MSVIVNYDHQQFSLWISIRRYTECFFSRVVNCSPILLSAHLQYLSITFDFFSLLFLSHKYVHSLFSYCPVCLLSSWPLTPTSSYKVVVCISPLHPYLPLFACLNTVRESTEKTPSVLVLTSYVIAVCGGLYKDDPGGPWTPEMSPIYLFCEIAHPQSNGMQEL